MGFGRQCDRYTYDFLVYTGKSDEIYNHGLGYSVVMKLMKTLLNQGYHLFFDNFYTSVKLLNDLLCYISIINS